MNSKADAIVHNIISTLLFNDGNYRKKVFPMEQIKEQLATDPYYRNTVIPTELQYVKTDKFHINALAKELRDSNHVSTVIIKQKIKKLIEEKVIYADKTLGTNKDHAVHKTILSLNYEHPKVKEIASFYEDFIYNLGSYSKSHHDEIVWRTNQQHLLVFLINTLKSKTMSEWQESSVQTFYSLKNLRKMEPKYVSEIIDILRKQHRDNEKKLKRIPKLTF